MMEPLPQCPTCGAGLDLLDDTLERECPCGERLRPIVSECGMQWEWVRHDAAESPASRSHSFSVLPTALAAFCQRFQRASSTRMVLGGMAAPYLVGRPPACFAVFFFMAREFCIDETD